MRSPLAVAFMPNQLAARVLASMPSLDSSPNSVMRWAVVFQSSTA